MSSERTSRRQAIVTVVGGAAAIVAACSPEKSSKPQEGAGTAPQEPAPSTTDTTATTDTTTSTGTDTGTDTGQKLIELTSCDAWEVEKTDLTNVPLADGALKASVRCYGRDQNLMLAVHWPTYDQSKDPITGLWLVASGGEVIAWRAIGQADVKAQRLRPVVFDNLILNTGIELFVVAQNGSKSVSKTSIKTDLFSTWEEKAVVDLVVGSAGISPGWIPQLQSIPKFAAVSGFAEDATIVFSNGQTLKTIQSGSLVSPLETGSSLLRGTVTDVMGNVLGPANEFTDIVEYQCFCTYESTGADGRFLRTMLRIG